MAIEFIIGGDVLVVDAVIREDHAMPSRASAFPVEDGSKISDNIVNDPETVTVEALVSNFPIEGGRLDAVTEAWRILKATRDARQLLTVVTGLEIYTDMALLNVTAPRDKTTGQTLRFTASFQKVRRVSTQIVSIPPEVTKPGKSRDQGASKVNGGKQTTKEITPDDSLANKTSNLKKLRNALGQLGSP